MAHLVDVMGDVVADVVARCSRDILICSLQRVVMVDNSGGGGIITGVQMAQVKK